MYCIKKITKDLTWIGGNDRRAPLFEGVYSIPYGVSYNSYLLVDTVTVLFDTVDKSVSNRFFENLEHVLNGRELNYVVVQHMEPDHSATLKELLNKYPKTVVVCNAKTKGMINQFFNLDVDFYEVDETSVLNTGRHSLKFVMAPMVHWPEVMVTYDTTEKILFSADAFGHFGALNGALFADEVDFEHNYMDEARRYYCNIVGKYGGPVQTLLKKAANLEIKYICPLHGFVWRKNINYFVEKYLLWSSYTPEQQGVMIAYASIYGNTENAAEILASKLFEKGIKVALYDVSVTSSAEILAESFKYSHLVFASSTYNGGIFVKMDDLLRDLAAHNIQNRTVAFIENGSWAATSGRLMKKVFEPCKNINFIEECVSIKSSLKPEQEVQLESLACEIAETLPKPTEEIKQTKNISSEAMFKIPYGLFLLSSKNGEKDCGCIINTVQQITDSPKQIAIAVNNANFTHNCIEKTKQFNISVLSESVNFNVIENFGFQSNENVDKFSKFAENVARTENGLAYLTEFTNAVISANVKSSYNCGTHTVFVAEVVEALVLNNNPSVTYNYYLNNIKPKSPKAKSKKGFVCKVCGYVYEGEILPENFVCPICKQGTEAFEKLK